MCADVTPFSSSSAALLSFPEWHVRTDFPFLSSPGQVFALLSKESAHKLLILAGLSAEESGDVLLHKGLFSPRQLKQILAEQV